MSKLLWITAFTLVALLIPAAVIADDATFQVARRWPLAPGLAQTSGQSWPVSPEGQVWVAWKRVAPDGSQAELMLASSPDWAPKVVAPLDPTYVAQTSLALSAESRITLSWSQPATDTLKILQQTWPMDEPLTPRTGPCL